MWDVAAAVGHPLDWLLDKAHLPSLSLNPLLRQCDAINLEPDHSRNVARLAQGFLADPQVSTTLRGADFNPRQSAQILRLLDETAVVVGQGRSSLCEHLRSQATLGAVDPVLVDLMLDAQKHGVLTQALAESDRTDDSGHRTDKGGIRLQNGHFGVGPPLALTQSMHNDIAVDTAFQQLGLDWRTPYDDVVATGRELGFHHGPVECEHRIAFLQALNFAYALEKDAESLKTAYPDDLVQWQGLIFLGEDPLEDDEDPQPAELPLATDASVTAPTRRRTTPAQHRAELVAALTISTLLFVLFCGLPGMLAL